VIGAWGLHSVVERLRIIGRSARAWIGGHGRRVEGRVVRGPRAIGVLDEHCAIAVGRVRLRTSLEALVHVNLVHSIAARVFEAIEECESHIHAEVD